ncbi:hypothetical protein F2Q69_00051053 [Brassica cretica]|uniref:Uncharacterized protein n=1 Tax=Brassica cretica TaxID=69181 RepID=A0A8S9Q5R9_BRACR|nr:hypothetical protein F2Q69_00051053 [Brassica cretica]
MKLRWIREVIRFDLVKIDEDSHPSGVVMVISESQSNIFAIEGSYEKDSQMEGRYLFRSDKDSGFWIRCGWIGKGYGVIGFKGNRVWICYGLGNWREYCRDSEAST